MSIEGLSFPSGHAIIAFGVAALIARHVEPRWRLVAFVAAGLVGVGRVYLGAHLPLDVLAGAAAGVALASVLNLVSGVPVRHAKETE